MASDWHPTLSKDSCQFGGPSIGPTGLDSSVDKSAGTSNQRSQVQTPIQSNFLRSSEMDLSLVRMDTTAGMCTGEPAFHSLTTSGHEVTRDKLDHPSGGTE